MGLAGCVRDMVDGMDNMDAVDRIEIAKEPSHAIMAWVPI